jgi:hypothetical protein
MKTIKRIKKGDWFTSQLEQCSFIKKRSTENGYTIKETSANVVIFVSDEELKIARKERAQKK